MNSFDRVWYWRRWLGERKGQRCRIIARGAMNTALVEFEDGYLAVVIRHGIRKVKVK